MAKKPIIPTIIPLVAAAKQIAKVSWLAEIGGMRKSITWPNTLDMVIDDDEFAKEFCTMTMLIKPGAMNSPKEILGPNEIFLPIASIKIAKKSKALITGEIKV